MLIHDQLYTVEKFEHFCHFPENQDRLLELIHGKIVEKLPTEEHCLIAGNIGYALGIYIKQFKTGRVGFHVDHHMPQDDYNLRMPDVCFNNVRRPLITEGSVPHMPALAVDVQLPDVL